MSRPRHAEMGVMVQPPPFAFEPISHIPQAEAEANCYPQIEELASTMA